MAKKTLMSYIVTSDHNKARLDKFLTEKLAGTKTRSQIKKLIEHGLILVDNAPAKVHQFLKTGQQVTIKQTELQSVVLAKKKIEKILEPNILFENKDYVVLEKPAGLLVHPTDKGETNTLANWLVKKYPKMEAVGQHQYRAGIIHRLDRDVSGVMVAVKTQKMFDHLKNLFKGRQVDKEYIALVYGKIEQLSGEINLPIGRNKDGQFVAHPKIGKNKIQAKDKLAKTKYKVLEYINNYTLLEVKILTGRTHQIRIHLSAIGHPILGDKIYKPRKPFLNLLRTKIKVIEAPRIFLHSTKLGFKDLSGEYQEFNSPLPKELKNFLNEKRK